MSISEAAKVAGVAPGTLRRWEREGKIKPERTVGGNRRYTLAMLKPHMAHQASVAKKTVAYARVSSHDQKADLERQKQMLEMYCAAQGWQFEILADLGSGMNYHKRGLRKLLSMILDEQINRLVLTHKDRLLRLGAELVFAICEEKQVEVVIINQGDESSFEEDLAKDVLEIITVFSARLYGARSPKNKKLIEGMQEAVDAAGA
jgi:predicted site-specific integrase-resolvase